MAIQQPSQSKELCKKAFSNPALKFVLLNIHASYLS